MHSCITVAGRTDTVHMVGYLKKEFRLAKRAH